ncbi:hypothetical protein CR513_56475, partial [Mucuna pruriens]
MAYVESWPENPKLGYKPIEAYKRRAIEEKKKRRATHLEGGESGGEKNPNFDLYKNFKSGGFTFAYQVAMAKDDQDTNDQFNLVYPSVNNHLKNNNALLPCYDFDHPIHQADEDETDLETPVELERLVARGQNNLTP